MVANNVEDVGSDDGDDVFFCSWSEVLSE